MIFAIKKSKITVDCFTTIGAAATDYPIERASAFVPNWWKTLPHYNSCSTEHGVEVQTGTMKGCLGFIDLYANGFVMPLWCDLNLKIDENKFSYQLGAKSDAFGAVIHHKPDQYNNRFKNHVHFKIAAPWLFFEKTGVKFVITPCSWTGIEEFPKLSFLNGIVSFNTSHSCNINGFALQENLPYQYNMKAGFPLAHIIPITDKQVEIKIHHIDPFEWEKLTLSVMPNKFYSWGISRRKLLNKK